MKSISAAVLASALQVLVPVVFAAPSGAADGVPALDVNSSCRAEATVAPESRKQCMQDEQNAREVLSRQWDQYGAADRRQCTDVATLGGTKSYVELLTCLQMARDARKLPSNDQ